jgi:Flp pilus assembly pilin Flp
LLIVSSTQFQKSSVVRHIMVENKRTRGVTIVEYAIMLALIAISIAVAAPSVTSTVIVVFSRASSVLNK